MMPSIVNHLSPNDFDSTCINCIYKRLEKINEGSFGYLFKGLNLVTKQGIAIKIEKPALRAKSSLAREARILRCLQNIPGIPEIYWYGKEKSLEAKALVMELLGKSLEERLKRNGKFSLKTILLLGEQLIELLKNIHSRGVLHRDLKPENILLGRGKNYKKVYLIDYGISKRYLKPSGEHIILTNFKPFIGTVRYASESAHQGLEQSRKDDLESLGYALIYMMKGNLPWMHQGFKREEKKKKVGEIKRNITLDELCEDMPSIFSLYFKYVRNLAFYDTPNYDYLLNLFSTLQKSMNLRLDTKCWDWKKGNSKSNDHSISSDGRSRTVSSVNINIHNQNGNKPEEYEHGITERPGILLKMKKLNAFCEKSQSKIKAPPRNSKSLATRNYTPATSFLDGSKSVYTNSKSVFSEFSVINESLIDEKQNVLGFMNYEDGNDEMEEYIANKSMAQMIKGLEKPIKKK